MHRCQHSTNTGDFQEGDASASFVNTNDEFLSITDALLNSGFPLKSSDGATGDFSVTFWYKANGQDDFRVLVSKWDFDLETWSFIIRDNNGT